MTYDELIKRMRECAEYVPCIMDREDAIKAADAIEELSKRVPPIPHGRLIDADALIKLLDNCMFPSDMVTTRAVSMVRNWLIDAPTIIESEGEDADEEEKN